jgi:hypothetical protein
MRPEPVEGPLDTAVRQAHRNICALSLSKGLRLHALQRLDAEHGQPSGKRTPGDRAQRQP